MSFLHIFEIYTYITNIIFTKECDNCNVIDNANKHNDNAIGDNLAITFVYV